MCLLVLWPVVPALYLLHDPFCMCWWSGSRDCLVVRGCLSSTAGLAARLVRLALNCVLVVQVASPATDAGAAAIADSARQLDTEVDLLWRLDTSILRRAATLAAQLHGSRLRWRWQHLLAELLAGRPASAECLHQRAGNACRSHQGFSIRYQVP
jgi:hypothetical protein